VTMDEQNDLSLSEDEAENVVGGKKKSQKHETKKFSNPQTSVGHSKPMINIQGPTNPVEQQPEDPAEYGLDPDA